SCRTVSTSMPRSRSSPPWAVMAWSSTRRARWYESREEAACADAFALEKASDSTATAAETREGDIGNAPGSRRQYRRYCPLGPQVSTRSPLQDWALSSGLLGVPAGFGHADCRLS